MILAEVERVCEPVVEADSGGGVEHAEDVAIGLKGAERAAVGSAAGVGLVAGGDEDARHLCGVIVVAEGCGEDAVVGAAAG